MFIVSLALLCAVPALKPQVATSGSTVQQIEDRFKAARPSNERLAFYSLDWAMSLAEAKLRAKKENRPILLILNTNITAGTNFFSGHT